MLFDFNLALDWGLPQHGSEASGELGGTLAYMAPERLRALSAPGPTAPPRPRDRHRADLYALGLILAETLTGRPTAVPDPAPATWPLGWPTLVPARPASSG